MKASEHHATHRSRPSSASPPPAPPAKPGSTDRLIAAVAAQTDCTSAVLDELRQHQSMLAKLHWEARTIRFRVGICALALLPMAIMVVLTVFAFIFFVMLGLLSIGLG